MKRAFDVAACALFLVVFSPILLLIIVAIRLQSPGKAIFAQTRVGQNGRPFTCYKLRTMHSGTANLPSHQVQASAITALGEHLRRLKIDEVPQLWNVLIGDMSLVGPRPCLPSQTELVEARRRLGVLEVRPGITGLAQVSGVDMSDANRLAEMDAQYVRSQSLLGDFGLLWATLRGKGVGVDRVVRFNK
jgi:O-antigen biosynthesis protein WbqP